MFEKATRLKLRFDSPSGLLSIEDLWTIPLTSKTGRTNLDDIAKNIYKKLKENSETISFVDEQSNNNEVDELKFEIIKHIISVRVAERKAAATAAANKEMKQKIMAKIAEKRDQAFDNKSIEELEKMLQGISD